MQQQTRRINGGRSDDENLDLLEARYGGRFLRQEAPAEKLPEVGMPAVDALRLVSEELVIEAVDALRGNRTIIVIAHRMSTIRNCDYAFALRDGELAASGLVADLLARSQPVRAETNQASAAAGSGR